MKIIKFVRHIIEFLKTAIKFKMTIQNIINIDEIWLVMSSGYQYDIFM